MDFSKMTDDQLRDELDGVRKALGANLGHPFDGREEAHKSKLLEMVAAIEAELKKRAEPHI
ncbi:MAG: hypothetical protein WCF20_07810 [Methylovirgula sp.]